MSRIEWDVNGSRRFESGIDRAVLYLPNSPGIAWNGVTQVSETATGGTAREFFIDGRKFLNLSTLEEYSATIQALSCPPEFAPCNGLLWLSPGLYVSGQPSQPFNFSYRTLIGDDVFGAERGYKIHIVYNALAKPADFVNQSISKTPNVKPYSWVITTIPEVVGALKPSSHFIIDSTKFDSVFIENLENILYGTEDYDSYLPTAQELGAILGITVPPHEPPESEIAYFYDGPDLKKMTILATLGARSSGSGGLTRDKLQISGTGSTITPFKIGSGYDNKGLWRTFHVARPTSVGDTLFVACTLDDTSVQLENVSDTQGNVYEFDHWGGTPMKFGIWRCPGATGGPGGIQSRALSTSDNMTVHVNDTDRGMVAMMGIALPGQFTDVVDVDSGVDSGTGTTPSASAIPSADNEIALAMFCHLSAGGAPTAVSPFASLGYQRGGSGSGNYVEAEYRILGSGTHNVSQTARETIKSAAWKSVLYLFKRKVL